MLTILLSSFSIAIALALLPDLEWKLIYVGSAKSEEYDQELDSCMGMSDIYTPPPDTHELLAHLYRKI